MIAKPVLKWAGGKTGSLPDILSRLPSKIRTYYEPFVGGGAVFFALANEKRFERAVIGDVNSELACVYQVLSRNQEKLIDELRAMSVAHDENFYYAMRARNPNDLYQHVRAARLIYLNKTCFNGLYRVNRKGEFNVPIGDYKNPTICDIEALRAAAKILHGVRVLDFDFEVTVQDAKRGDAVYFDPPYVPASDTANFTAYAKSGFGPEEQARLRNIAEKLVARGVHVLLSNSDTPAVRELYQGFKLESVKARRAINSKGGKRGPVGELLISAKGKW